MATKTQYYNLDKPSYDEVADIEVINADMDKIDQQMRNNADGVNFAKAISSDAYDNSKSYAVGDYCIYNNKLYRCITAIESAEAFNIAKWEQTTIGNEVSQLNNNLNVFFKNFTHMTFQQLFDFSKQNNKMYVGYIDWSSDIAVPDKGTAFVFITDWQVMAISIGINKVYHLRDDGWV